MLAVKDDDGEVIGADENGFQAGRDRRLWKWTR
jgi:hypothetical protein